MRPLKLHTKTTLLASAITLAVLVTVLLTVSARVVNLVREDQKELAELQAANLADHISAMPNPRDVDAMARAANLVKGARPNIVSVRIWERSGGVFMERAAAAGSLPAVEIPDETKEALRGGLPYKITSSRPSSSNESLYRVFAPVNDQGRVSGAVEVIERLDDTPSIARRFVRSAVWIAAAAIVLITVLTYLLFRYLIYQPIERLLAAMSRARSGELTVEVQARTPDELGNLSLDFNSMIGQIREMTDEREAQQRLLQERIKEATIELQERNLQLEDANLELWRTTRLMTQLERLAAAGQTAAQFAHEVGTPLNIISGHVQLLRAGSNVDSGLANERLTTITEQIERIERIVRQMLDRTRSETLQLSPLDLNSLLQRTFYTAAPLLEERGVRLNSQLSADIPLIAGDADRLQQVFINLINNSLDAMPDGGELLVSTEVEPDPDAKDNNLVVLTFSDNGCGMTNEIRAHIFDPMYTTKKPGRGTGIGLVVVKQVISEHNGRVDVVSEPRRGSRFRLKFPALREDT